MAKCITEGYIAYEMVGERSDACVIYNCHLDQLVRYGSITFTFVSTLARHVFHVSVMIRAVTQLLTFILSEGEIKVVLSKC